MITKTGQQLQIDFSEISDNTLTRDNLIGIKKNKPPVIKITFPTPDNLKENEYWISDMLNKKCPKAFYSVSAGEL